MRSSRVWWACSCGTVGQIFNRFAMWRGIRRTDHAGRGSRVDGPGGSTRNGGTAARRAACRPGAVCRKRAMGGHSTSSTSPSGPPPAGAALPREGSAVEQGIDVADAVPGNGEPGRQSPAGVVGLQSHHARRPAARAMATRRPARSTSASVEFCRPPGRVHPSAGSDLRRCRLAPPGAGTRRADKRGQAPRIAAAGLPACPRRLCTCQRHGPRRSQTPSVPARGDPPSPIHTPAPWPPEPDHGVRRAGLAGPTQGRRRPAPPGALVVPRSAGDAPGRPARLGHHEPSGSTGPGDVDRADGRTGSGTATPGRTGIATLSGRRPPPDRPPGWSVPLNKHRLPIPLP